MYVCERERERESQSQSQRDEKDKGKTDGTIDLCVKSTGAPLLLLLLLLLLFLSQFPSDKKPKTGCLDEPEPIDLSVLHLDSLTSRTAGMSRRKQSNPRQIKRKFFFFPNVV